MAISGGVPLSGIRMEIYRNTGKKTMRQVWNEKKPDILLDGPFFSWNTFAATCHMRIHGKTVVNAASKEGYHEWGFAWNDGESPQWCKIPCDKDNYFTNTVLVVDGQKRQKPAYHADSDGTPSKPRYTSRPALGVKDNRLMYYVTSGNMSLAGLQGLLFTSGWKWGLMLDGGGSTMFKDATREIYSSRRIPYFILIYFVDNEPKGDKPMITVHSYSLKKDGDVKLSKNFKVKEFACGDGSDVVFVAPKLVEILQQVRIHYNRGVTILSGYRTPSHNKKVGGAEFSQHMYGTAADISIKGIKPATVAAYVRSLMPNYGGVGVYVKQNFVHVDVREKRADWTD